MTATPQPAPLEMVVEVLKFYGEDEALSILTAYMASAYILRCELNASEASAASPAVPEGYWFAPNEPTEEMIEAALRKSGWNHSAGGQVHRHVYAAMRAAAPLPPAASAWQGMENAPMDGTKVDLLYPYPRGRTIDCFWAERPIGTGWWWLTPVWKGEAGALSPESEWNVNSYLNAEPLAWMLPPPPPSMEGG